MPPDLLLLVRVVTGPQEQSKRDPRLQLPDDEGVPVVVDYSEAARLLSVSASTVARMVKAGQLRTVTFGAAKRIPRSEIERVVDEQMARHAKETV